MMISLEATHLVSQTASGNIAPVNKLRPTTLVTNQQPITPQTRQNGPEPVLSGPQIIQIISRFPARMKGCVLPSSVVQHLSLQQVLPCF